MRRLAVLLILAAAATSSCAVADDAPRLQQLVQRIAANLGKSEDEVRALINRTSRETGRDADSVATLFDDLARQRAAGPFERTAQEVAERHPGVPRSKVENFLLGAGCDALDDAAAGEEPDLKEIASRNAAAV
ncbi:MAG TPA: hypothetical protein VGP30_00845, partial [Candidatus Limnocylindrales bacterium]|nr:hypothetical protein [Candidatus Limnocylindrales bacterium]